MTAKELFNAINPEEIGNEFAKVIIDIEKLLDNKPVKEFLGEIE